MTSTTRTVLTSRLLGAALFAIGLLSWWAFPPPADAARSVGLPAIEGLPKPPVVQGLPVPGVAKQNVFTSGRYVFIQGVSGPVRASALGTLVDEQTGKRTEISRTGCTIGLGSGLQGARPPAPIGGPWLLFNCASGSDPHGNLELYGLASGQWRAVALNSSVEAFINSCADQQCGASAIAVGADWVEFEETCYHCRDTYVFQNLHSGQLEKDPTNGTTTVDLSSPGLARRVCPPLRALPGLLSFNGAFAIIDQGQLHLERCGTHLHELIDPRLDLLAASPSLVLWRSPPNRLTAPTELIGLFLPSLRRFTITVPAHIGYLQQLAVTMRTLYVVNSKNHLWTARISAPPPRP